MHGRAASRLQEKSSAAFSCRGPSHSPNASNVANAATPLGLDERIGSPTNICEFDLGVSPIGLQLGGETHGCWQLASHRSRGTCAGFRFLESDLLLAVPRRLESRLSLGF